MIVNHLFELLLFLFVKLIGLFLRLSSVFYALRHESLLLWLFRRLSSFLDGFLNVTLQLLGDFVLLAFL